MIRLDARMGLSSSEAARLRLQSSARLRRYRQYQEFYEGRHFEPGPFEVALKSVTEPGPSGIGVSHAQAIQRGIEHLVRPTLEAKARPANGGKRHSNLLPAILGGLGDRRRADHGILLKEGLSRV